MKYKLINRATNEAHICDKVTISGLDYYVSDEKPINGEPYYVDNSLGERIETAETKPSGIIKRIICSNNQNIDIPKVINEVDYLYKNHKQTFIWEPATEGVFHFKAGYNKSQETNPNSDEDMRSFGKFCTEYDYRLFGRKSYEELLLFWKSQQPKVIYYG